MDFRNYSWANSISAILKKTEKNLERAQSSLVRPSEDLRSSEGFALRPSIDSFVRDKKSFVFDNEDLYGNQQEMQQFRNMVVDRLNQQQKEIEKMKRKQGMAGKNAISEVDVRSDMDLAISAIEKRMLSEIRRIEASQKQYVTQEMLKYSEEIVKNDHLDQVNQLEINFQNLRENCEKITASVSKNAEESSKKLSQSFLSLNDIRKIRESITKENENSISEITVFCQGIDTKYSEFVDKLHDEIYKLQTQADKSMKIIRELLVNNEAKVLQKFERHEGKIDDAVEKNKEEYRKIMGMVVEKSEFEAGIGKIWKSIPKISELATKQELLEVKEQKIGLEVLKNYATKAEVETLMDEKPGFLHFATKNDLENLKKQQTSIFEAMKSSFATKSELSKLKHQAPQVDPSEIYSDLAMKVKENQKSNENLIQKLVQLEQRVILIEDSESESESLKLIPVKRKEKLGSLPTEYGSKETDYSVPQFSRSIHEVNLPKTHVEEFVQRFTEEFINNEILVSMEWLKTIDKKEKSKKNKVPRLQIPVLSNESPLDSNDDLNKAVIMHSDFTNKSESPIDFSLFR